MSLFDRMRAMLRGGVRRSRNLKRSQAGQPNHRIVLGEERFQVFHIEDDFQVVYERRFDSILEAHVYKADLITTDEIRCEISFMKDGELLSWTADEEMEGFRSFVDRLAQGPHGIGDWVSPVMQPAFETNWTLIYRRPDLGPLPTAAPLEATGA